MPSLKHKFVSPKSDAADTSLVRPSNWNDEHDLTMTGGNILARATAGVGAVEELAPSDARSLIQVDPFGSFTGTNSQTSTSYTLQLTDRGKIIIMNNAAANTLTIPADASVSFPLYSVIGVLQDGAGQTSITINTDTLNSISNRRKMRAQYSFALLFKISQTRWLLSGDIVL